VSGAITGLIVLIGAYYVVKTGKIEEIVMDSVENLLSDVGNNESLQKSIYTIGALIGNGVKSGVGLQKRGGKMSLTDLIVQSVAGRFLNQGTETVKSTEDAFKVD
jgi:hypothetical protein